MKRSDSNQNLLVRVSHPSKQQDPTTASHTALQSPQASSSRDVRGSSGVAALGFVVRLSGAISNKGPASCRGSPAWLRVGHGHRRLGSDLGSGASGHAGT